MKTMDAARRLVVAITIVGLVSGTGPVVSDAHNRRHDHRNQHSEQTVVDDRALSTPQGGVASSGTIDRSRDTKH